jgi:hypothetical protein
MVIRFVTCAALVAGIVGCSDDPYKGRSPVSGSVKLKGQPLKEGIVMFEPMEGQDTGTNAPVVDGLFEIPREGGLKAGKYLVRVTSGDGKTATNPVDDDNPPGPTGGTNIVSKDLVPASWNTRSKQEVTVKADGPNKFDFDIKDVK